MPSCTSQCEPFTTSYSMWDDSESARKYTLIQVSCEFSKLVYEKNLKYWRKRLNLNELPSASASPKGGGKVFYLGVNYHTLG